MQLADDDAFGAVDDEGSLLGHERDFTHVGFLLFDVLDFGLAGLVGLADDQLEAHLERDGKGHAALDALADAVLGRTEAVFHEFQCRRVVGRLNRKYGREDFLKTLVFPQVGRDVQLQKLAVGKLLRFEQVRHLHLFGDARERNTLGAEGGLFDRHERWNLRPGWPAYGPGRGIFSSKGVKRFQAGACGL